MIYLGQDPIGITTEPNVSGKADKVANATNGNFAALDSNGNLTDSGHSNADYVQDVQIDGTSILSEGVANIPISSQYNFGVVKNNGEYGVYTDNSGFLRTASASTEIVKAGTNSYRTIKPSNQHEATFYGLAKAAGADMASSSNAVGTYTDAAKTAIRTMLGAVGTTDYPPNTGATAGVVKVDNTYSGVSISGTNTLVLTPITDAVIKSGTSATFALNAQKQHQSVFYGLAKAAGDTTQSQSDNAVGTYTDDAKTAIRTMLGAVGSTSYASTTTAGVVKISGGFSITAGTLSLNEPVSTVIKNGINTNYAILPSVQHTSVFYGLAKAAGDTTQASSDNVIGTYTNAAKTAIQTMLGVESGVSFVEQVTGTTPSITGIANTRYVCGEVTSISITPPATGIIDVTFTSGTTPAVLTIPNTVTFPAWFDPTTLDANKVYEINIIDGVRGVVTTW